MNKMRASLLLILGFLFFSSPALAQNPPVLINEICWMGTKESSYSEWIELKNQQDKEAEITGWRMETKDKGLEIELKGTIKPHGFFVLERSDEQTLPGIESDLIYTGSLHNHGETLVLLDPEGKTVDMVEAEEGWPKGDNRTKQTMERNEGWQTSEEPGGTPGRENSPGLNLPRIKKESRPEILNWNSYKKPADQRFLKTLCLGVSCSLLSSTLILIIKRRFYEGRQT